MAAGKGRVSFLRGEISGRLPMLQQVYPHPCAYRQAAQTGLCELFKKKKGYEVEREMGGAVGELGVMRDGYEQAILNT